MPSRKEDVAFSGRRDRTRVARVLAGSLLACGLLLLGLTSSASASTDIGAKTSSREKNDLIAQALSEGLITEDDLVPDPPGTVVLFAAPTVTAVAPTGGPLKGGQIVSITGTGFTGATAVKFGSVNATTYAIVSSTKIVAKVPDASAGGAVLLAVTNADGTNTTGSTYTYGAPTVTAVSPAFVDPTDNATVTITGTGFLGAVAADVEFGSDAAVDIWVVSDTQIVAKTPKDDTVSSPAVPITRALVDVVVTRNSVASATGAGSKFLFTDGLPTITTLGTSGSPVTGTDGAAIGATLTITGTKLWGVKKVNFGATAVTASADISVASNGNSMTVKVPTRAAGPVDVTVENARGASTTNLSTRFNYIGATAPTVTAVTPSVLNKASSGGGGSFLVTGTGFSGIGTSQVTLKCTSDVTPSAVTVVSDASVIVTVGGNGGTAEACDLEIENAVDNTKKVTVTDGVRYV